MATTRLFRNGNSQAVRIPAELAYERTDLELEIERCGDELRIRPAGRPIRSVPWSRWPPSRRISGRGPSRTSSRTSGESL